MVLLSAAENVAEWRAPRSRFGILALVAALVPLSIDLYLPALPLIAAELQAGPGEAERSLAALMIGLSLGPLVHGPLSDRIGRRPVLLAGLGVQLLGSLACAGSTTLESLIAARFVQGIGGGAGLVLTLAILRDRLDAPACARALSLLMLVTGLGPILAPLLGGWMLAGHGCSWRTLFLLQAGLAVLCLAALSAVLPETRPPAGRCGPRNVLHDYAGLIRDRRLLLPALCGGFGSAGLFAWLAGSPRLLAQGYGLDAAQTGQVLAAGALSLVLVSQLNARWLLPRQCGPERALRTLLWLPLLSALALPLAAPGSLAGLMAAVLAYVGSLGAIGANSTALALRDQGEAAGSAASLLLGLQCLLATLSSTLLSLLPGSGLLPTGLAMAVCAGLCFVTGWLATDEWRDQPSKVSRIAACGSSISNRCGNR